MSDDETDKSLLLRFASRNYHGDFWLKLHRNYGSLDPNRSLKN